MSVQERRSEELGCSGRKCQQRLSTLQLANKTVGWEEGDNPDVDAFGGTGTKSEQKCVKAAVLCQLDGPVGPKLNQPRHLDHILLPWNEPRAHRQLHCSLQKEITSAMRTEECLST